MSIAEQARDLRKSVGMSQESLATEMRRHDLPHWSRSTVVKFEAGQRESLAVDELLALAATLRVPPSHFLDPPCCEHCHDNPPPGFTCNTCGATRD